MKTFGTQKIRVSVSDVRTLYANQGISDAIMDLYIKWVEFVVMQPRQHVCYRSVVAPGTTPGTIVLGPLSFTAIDDVLSSGKQVSTTRLKERFRATCAVKPEDLLDQEKVNFPCNLRWDWGECMTANITIQLLLQACMALGCYRGSTSREEVAYI